MKSALFLAIIALCFLPNVDAATRNTFRPRYEVVEIFPSGTDVVIYPGTLRLNNSNVVVGVRSLGVLNPVETFFWQPEQALQWRQGQINDINDKGAFVGTVEGAVFAGASAINNADLIAGSFQNRAFIGDANGQMNFPLGENIFSEARSLNNFGIAAGIALLPPNGRFTPVIFATNNVTDLGWIRGTSLAETTAINDQGHVLFTALHTNRFRFRSYLYRGSKPRPLPSRPQCRHTIAFAMNNFDEVVGYVGRNNSPVPRGGSGAITVIAGFLYSGGRLYDLNKLLTPASEDWNISEARDINDSGSIVAFASRPGMPLVPVLLRRTLN